jgi:hypothetical protein
VVVTTGDTETELLVCCDPGNPLIETEVALVVVQLSTDVWPAVIVGGLAMNEITVGSEGAALNVAVTLRSAVMTTTH